MKSPRLTSMTIEALVSLRKKIDARILKAVEKERKRIVGILGEIDRLDGFKTKVPDAPTKRAYKKQRRKAAIKYRGHKGEKWSGRGMTPLWMRAYIKAGKKKESFLVK